MASCLIQGMEQAGYEQADKEEFKAMIAIFAPKEGDWITVASDVIQWEKMCIRDRPRRTSKPKN